MTNVNTKSKLEFIVDNILWAVALLIWYQNLCFVHLPGLTVGASKLILWAMEAVGVFAGICITFRKRRNSLSVVINTLLPVEVYGIISLFSFFTVRIVVVLAVAAFAALVFTAFVMIRPINRSANPKKVIGRRISHSLLGIRTIAVICAVTFLVPVAANTFAGKGLYTSKAPASAESEDPEFWTINNQIDTVKLLRQDRWEKLRMQEKMEVLGVVKNIELRYLGVKHEVYLKTSQSSQYNVAFYSPSEHTISININTLEDCSAEEVLHSVAHECYHAYQYQQVELYNIIPEEYKDLSLFDNAKKYNYEFNNYIDATEDYDGYDSQLVEVSADKYGESAVEEYYTRLQEYENK